jgi:uncharacterized protein (TIGR00299 family) protein
VPQTPRQFLHIDPFSGMAGDMFLGACVDLGLPIEAIAGAVAAIEPFRDGGVTVETRRASRQGIGGVRFRVLEHGRPIEGPDPEESDDAGEHSHHPHSHPHPPHTQDHAPLRDPARGDAATAAHPPHRHGRSMREVARLVEGGELAPAVRERALSLFWRLAEAEGRIHGMAAEDVHFHEVGAVDSIVDLVGAAAAMDWLGRLGPLRVTCGPVNVGAGRVHAAHGDLPIPAPATAELLRGVPIYSAGDGELLTPTGAVLLAELVDEFRELPPFTLGAIGYGLGKRDTPGRANAVRLLRGEVAIAEFGEVLVVECEVDHLAGEALGFLFERLFEHGVLDAYFTPVQMKKQRPGVLVTVLCRRELLESVAGILMVESGSLGCRYAPWSRFEAQRESGSVETRYGKVAVKRAVFRGRRLAATPEFDDCRRLALEHGVAFRDVHGAALAALAREGA